MKAFGNERDLFPDSPDQFRTHRSFDDGRAVQLFNDGHSRFLFFLRHDLFGPGLRIFITTDAFGDELINFRLGHHAFPDQTIGINGPYAWMRLHARVHQRLRVARLVGFVVTEFAEADYIQHDVFIELLPVIQRDSKGSEGGFRIVTIDVKDWQLRHARDVS